MPISNDKFPPVPILLLEELERRFPERSAEETDTFESMRWRGGQTSVVRLLRRMFHEREERALNGSILEGFNDGED